MVYYPASALVTLFTNILQNPQDQRARTDLRLMAAVAEFLRDIVEKDRVDGFEDSFVKRMLVVCGAFQQTAEAVLDKAEKAGPNKRKRKPDDALSGARMERLQQQQQQPQPQPQQPQQPQPQQPQQQQQQLQIELPEAASTVGLSGGAVSGMPANMDTNSQVCIILEIAALCASSDKSASPVLRG